MSLQVVSITVTSVLSCYSLIALYGVALDVDAFRCWFRSPKVLWVSILISLCILQALNFMLTAARPLSSSPLAPPGLAARMSWAAILVGHGFSWFCLGNEASLA